MYTENWPRILTHGIFCAVKKREKQALSHSPIDALERGQRKRVTPAASVHIQIAPDFPALNTFLDGRSGSLCSGSHAYGNLDTHPEASAVSVHALVSTM